MKVFFHSRDGDVDVSAVFDEREEMLAEICFVSAEVVVCVNADNGIEEFAGEGKGGRVRMDGDDVFGRKAHLFEKPHVLRWIAPEVGGKHAESILFCEEDGGDPLTAAKIHDGGSGPDGVILQKFFG